MRTFGRILFLLFKAVSYLCLIVAIAAFAALSILLDYGHCDRIDTGAIQCGTEGARGAATAALSVILLGAFTGLPFLLAFSGGVFLVRDLWRLRPWRKAA
jgi:hypothetical protein